MAGDCVVIHFTPHRESSQDTYWAVAPKADSALATRRSTFRVYCLLLVYSSKNRGIALRELKGATYGLCGDGVDASKSGLLAKQDVELINLLTVAVENLHEGTALMSVSWASPLFTLSLTPECQSCQLRKR